MRNVMALFGIAMVLTLDQAQATPCAAAVSDLTEGAAPLQTENWFMQAVGPEIAKQTLPNLYEPVLLDRKTRVADDGAARL